MGGGRCAECRVRVDVKKITAICRVSGEQQQSHVNCPKGKLYNRRATITYICDSVSSVWWTLIFFSAYWTHHFRYDDKNFVHTLDT